MDFRRIELAGGGGALAHDRIIRGGGTRRAVGSAVEVVDGLNGDEQIIVTPSDSLTSGTVVRAVKPES